MKLCFLHTVMEMKNFPQWEKRMTKRVRKLHVRELQLITSARKMKDHKFHHYFTTNRLFVSLFNSNSILSTFHAVWWSGRLAQKNITPRSFGPFTGTS